jgi:hypothetical protein
VDLLSIETYISQLITLPGEQQGTAKAIFLGLRRPSEQISAVYDDTIESKPKNMLSFLDTEEVPGKAFDTVIMSKQRQSPARPSMDNHGCQCS